MAFLDVLEAARIACAGVPGIVTAYQTTPGRAVPKEKLPAVVQAIGTVAYEWSNSQDDRRYTWPLHILYRRDGDLMREEDQIAALAELVVVAFYSQTQHNLPRLLELRPTDQTAPRPLALFEGTYTGVTLTMFAKEKFRVDFS